MSSSESTKNEVEESGSNEFYCTRCGVKSSMRKETDCIYSGMSHEHIFQAYPKDTYCVWCGVSPGARTNCTKGSSLFPGHTFESLPKDTFCTRCGFKPGGQTVCVGQRRCHDFTLQPKDTHCRRCGVKPGARTECISPDRIHDFIGITHSGPPLT
jgi:rubredoxin